jgi:HEAT repeat protein
MEDAVKRLTPLGMFFSAVKSERFLREIPVRPLNREDTREMIKAILPGLPPAPKLEDLIWSAAGGNPLFVQAHLKSLIAQGQITVREGAVALDLVAEPQAPKSMEAAVSSELAALDQETSSLVTNAAIAGPVVELQLLQSLIGVNQGFAQQLLDKAQKAAILDQDEEEARVKFASEAVRQVAYQQTDEEVRRKAHGQIAQVIEEKSKDNLDAVLAELAHHYGKSGYKEKAVEFQTRLKTLARSIFDPNETGLITVKKVAPKIPELDRILSASSASRILPFVTAFLDAVAGIEASPPGQDPPPDLGRNVRLALMPILDNDDPLTVSVAAEHVIANGLPITADPKDPLPLRWRRVLLGHNARSITFRSGVQDREIELLLNAFAHRSRVHVGLLWPVWLGENDIENIYIEQEIKTAKLIREGEGPSATFSAMRGAPAPPPKPAAPAPSPPPADQEAAPPPAGSLAARLGRDSWTQGQKAVAPKTAIGLAERFLKSPATSIMSKEARDALLRAFDTAITEDDRDSIGTLVDAVKSCLTNPSADVRLQATGLLEAIFSKCEAHKCESLEDVMTGILCEVLPREMDARVYGRFGRIASEAANRTLKRGDYDTVRRLVDALMHAGDQGTATRAFRALQIGPTQQLLNSEFFDLLLDDLGSGDPDRESAANFVLNIFGDLVVSRAVRALSESESVRARLAVVSILKAHRHAALAPIQERFQASVHTAELKRILSVIGELLPEARSVISTALAHPSDEVAMEATRALSKLPAVEATVELVKLLDNPRLVARLEALRLIGDMRLTDAEEDVRQMLSSDSEEVLREVCITLGKLGSTNSVSSLCRILRRRGFLGLFGGLSPAIRAAAAWALGQIGDVQAAPALRKASRDRKLAVQAAAKLALGSLAQKKTGEK